VSVQSVLDTFWAIENLRQVASWKRDKWLRDRGWEPTCETPGSFWMWKKLWTGRDGKQSLTILVDAKFAEEFQKAWDQEQDYREHPENYED
jgi:hypothetical protein